MSEWWVKYQGHILSAGIFYPEENWIPLKSTHGFDLATFRFNRRDPKGLIFMFHGMHCASSENSHIAQWFHKAGYAVLAFDQEGHGKSGGPRGNIISLNDYARDCENYIIKAKSYYDQNTPIFLVGESMGGSMCILVSLKIPELIRGIILIAPAIGVNPELEPFLQKVVRFLAYCCCGGLQLKALDQSMVSRNSYYAEYFNENPELYSGKLNARTSAAMLNGLENVQLESVKLATPFIVFQGGSDKITNAEQVKEFFKNAKSTDKELVFYDDMYHGVFHEPEVNEVFAKCVEWCEKRLI